MMLLLINPTKCLLYYRNFLIVVITCIVIFMCYESRIRHLNFSRVVHKTALKYIKFDETERPPRNINRLKRLIRENNELEKMQNLETFGKMKMNSIIIVIHVKKLTEHLKYLIVSLRQVRGIEEVLLIFSHSYYDENFNDFIRLIDFCRVMQLFYPYSVQANPNNFPGYDPNDCPHDMKEDKARKLNCTGAFTPDISGKYREPEVVEKKHHWWWTANKIFEDMKFSAEFDGSVVFLDNDLLIIEDFLYMLFYMSEAAASQNQCEFIALGKSDPRPSKYQYKEEEIYRVSIEPWNPDKHAIALAFNLNTWNKIVTHYDLFCNIDDNSWPRSLLEVSLDLDNSETFKVMIPRVPRAYKSPYGRRFASIVQIPPLAAAARVLETQEQYRYALFPMVLEIYTDVESINDEFKDFFYTQFGGGFSDPRDRMLCRYMTKRKIKKELFESAVEFRQKHSII